MVPAGKWTLTQISDDGAGVIAAVTLTPRRCEKSGSSHYVPLYCVNFGKNKQPCGWAIAVDGFKEPKIGRAHV